MQHKIILALALLSSTIISCNSGIDENAKQQQSNQPALNLPALPAANVAATNSSSLTDSTIKPAVLTTTTAAATNATNTSTTLNPKHGLPGHRCDIAVGAPLSSTPATKAQTATPATIQATSPALQTQTPTLNSIQTTTTTKAATGLNPKHGQPGHRCDIAVGAPLDGKPAATTPASTPVNLSTTPTPASATAPAPLQTNVTKSIQASPFSISKPDAAGLNQNSNVKLNPAHGQPGHDCSIAVGKPLKQ
jgi:hypothetical protein